MGKPVYAFGRAKSQRAARGRTKHKRPVCQCRMNPCVMHQCANPCAMHQCAMHKYPVNPWPRRPRASSGGLMPGRAYAAASAAALVLLTGCDGPLSTLAPAGRAAEQIATLFWWLLGGAVVIWVIVVGLAVYAIRIKPEAHNRRRAGILIIGGGAVLPTLILAAYLTVGLRSLPQLTASAPEGSLTIHVTGEQWWWRVRYEVPGGGDVELANEVRLPVGEPVQFYLETADVIHSFWIPSIGGKIDMVPGRVNRLMLEPTRTGVYMGACAEYCGASHAKMQFYAVVTEREEFDQWLEAQGREAAEPAEPLARRGRTQFIANGCGACHAVRGTPARGRIGPDLTHVGSRMSIGAGILLTEPESIRRWIAHTADLKPDVLMPEFGMLPEGDLRAIAAYLSSLQ